MLRIDNDASSEASEDGRVVAYRDKFCGEQPPVPSSAWTAEADVLADEEVAADALDTDDGDSCLSETTLVDLELLAQCDAFEDSSEGGSESGDSSGSSSSAADDDAGEADGEGAAAAGKGADAALRGENNRGRQGGGAGSAKSKRSVRRYFQDEDSSVTCRHCGGIGHYARDCVNEKLPKPCFLCGEKGHTARDCLNQQCFKCRRGGHKSYQCPNRPYLDSTCYRCGRAAGHSPYEW